MPVNTKRVKDLSIGDRFRHNGSTYRVLASFMEGVAKTRIVATCTDSIYSRLPKDLTLQNQTIVEIV